MIEYQGDPWYTLYPLGDSHIGTAHADRNIWLRDVRRVAEDPNALWVGMGDMCECINRTDKRFEPNEIAPQFRDHLDNLVYKQAEAFMQDVWDIADKCVGLIEGNHESDHKRYCHIDVARNICDGLKVPYIGDTAYIRMVFRRVDDKGEQQKGRAFTVYAEHGSYNGRTLGGVLNYLERLMNSFEADVYMTAHCHMKSHAEKPILRMAPKGAPILMERKRIGLSTGAYYRTYQVNTTSYGQRRTFPPAALGAVPVRLRPLTGEIEVVS